jgi:thioredoxin-related protein
MSLVECGSSVDCVLSRRALLGALLGFSALKAARAAQVILPPARALRDEVAQALKAGQPLLVMVSLDGCPFCKIARENYLGPLQAQGWPMVQLDMRSHASLLDVDGSASTHERVARAWKIRLAPTLLFLGRAGQEIAPRLVGGSQSDFYGAYLDERLALAKAALGAP